MTRPFEPLLRALLLTSLVPTSACSLLVDGAFGGEPMMMGSACDGLDDGTPCMREGISAPLICLRNVCTNSRCGDGVLDRRPRSDGTFEDCDDGNAIDGDGCETSCSISMRCASPSDCPFPGIECLTATCDLGSGECAVAAADEGTPCNTDSGAGMCASGVCVAPGCGNGMLEAGEDCDDGNADYGDGCAPDCRPECTETSQCSQDPCVGVQECQTSTDPLVGSLGTCVVVEPGIACAGSCEVCDPTAAACVPSADADADGDGYPSTDCGGTDCNDLAFDVNPGRTEECDVMMTDVNCVDGDEPASTEWFTDCDGDGFPPMDARMVVTCERPSEAPDTCASGSGTWTSRRPISGVVDCYDENPDVYPLQYRYFDLPYRNAAGVDSYDYNCSGSQEPEYGDSATPAEEPCTSVPRVGCGARPEPPVFPQRVACGRSARLYTCESIVFACVRTEGPTTVKRCR